ncbi:hypothetical protein A9Z42_0046070 [Trichoderma parareesei]|uniref:Uncharacterized protein n=1 Tax=Trichoderma parareesei TaxID=858221 RepID=A0A2H2ZH55_TRIPA|nr:hypothetical protein A9Z42_0046070 [Trichoderma parareesei]
MNTPEKRRSGGRSNSTGPAWRTGHATHTSRHGSSAAGGGGGGGGTNTASSGAGGSNSGNLPVMPPRAAMASTSSTGGDDSHNAGATLLERKRKEKGGRDKDGVAGSSNSNNSSSSTARGSSPHGSNPSGSPVSKQQQHRRQQHSEAAAATATAHVLREKDERIAYLENEMAIMEREFHQELDKLSQAESETATFWQGKHSALNQQYLRTDTELRLLRAEVDVREAEREELRQGVEVLRRELQERDDEIRRLRGQVRGLKDFVSTSTRTDDQTSDEVFGDGMTKLGNGLQNWVITNFRKAKLDLSKASDDTLTELSRLVPMYEELVHTSKVHLLQSIVSSILVDMVFNAYYVGLSEQETQHIQQMERLLSSLCSSTDVVNQWRSSTLALLRREAHHLHDNTDAFAEAVMARITHLLDSIITTSPSTSSSSSSSTTTTTTTSSSSSSTSAATSANSQQTTARDSALRVLVKNSIELARLLVVQKARLRVYMPSILPHQQVLFEPDTMEDMGGEEDEDDNLASREISCVVFPGVIKHGDENGGHMQYRNVIVKARVLCSPEE